MRTVLIILFDGVQSLDVTGPLEVFAGANHWQANRWRAGHDGQAGSPHDAGGPVYQIRTASLGGRPVRTSSGLRLAPDGDLGYRMEFFAAQGLLEPLDDVWAKIGGNFNAATTSPAKGDGHFYFVPIYNYPWVIFYNKSTFASKGYAIPTTWDEPSRCPRRCRRTA